MAVHDLQFSQGVAMVLQGESLKASCYVTHAASLGVLREKMVSSFVRHETPERFRVETGLIRNHHDSVTSRQCDLLVHEPGSEAPLYRWEDFVVVHHTAARAVVEVKSELESREFAELLEVHRSVARIEAMAPGQSFIPTFGYGLKGVTFETFLSYLQNAVRENALELPNVQRHLNWPLCIAVQERSYIGFRPLRGSKAGTYGYYAFDFSRSTDSTVGSIEGIETGYFLQIFSAVLKEKTVALVQSDLDERFHTMPIAPEGKAWVAPDGTIHRGTIPGV